VPQQKDVALEQETKDNQQTIVKVDGQNNTIVKRNNIQLSALTAVQTPQSLLSLI